MEFFRIKCRRHRLYSYYSFHAATLQPHTCTYMHTRAYPDFTVQLITCLFYLLLTPLQKKVHFHLTLMENVLLSERELLVIQWTKAAVITHSELSRRRRLISANGMKWQLKVIASKLSPPSAWHRSFLHVPAHYPVGRGELQLDIIRGSFTRESGRVDCLVQCSDWQRFVAHKWWYDILIWKEKYLFVD